MKSIIMFLTISMVVLASLAMKQMDSQPQAFADNNEKKEVAIAYKEEVAVETPKNAEIAAGRALTSGDELLDAVRRKDKDAAMAIVLRIMKERRDKSHGAGNDENYSGHRSFRSFEEREDD